MSLRPATSARLEELQRDLQDTLTRAFDENIAPYKKVTVIFFRFSNDNMNVGALEKDLSKTFRDVYKFHTISFVIPASGSEDPGHSVTNFLLKGLNNGIGEEGNLIILVFSGHGTVQTEYRQQILHLGGSADNDGNLEGPTLRWTEITNILHAKGKADILHIMDCCCAAEAAHPKVEVLAATSGTEVAESEAQFSFTRALNEQLRLLGDQRFMTVADLYAKIIEERRALQLSYTPFYVGRFGKPSIRLQKMNTIGRARHIDISPDGPRVIMTAHVEGKIDKNSIDGIKKWLSTNISNQVKNIEVRLAGVWDTNSSILLLEMPLQIWSQLPYKPAYKMIEVVYSRNRLVTEAPTVTLASRPLPGSENQKPDYGSSWK